MAAEAAAAAAAKAATAARSRDPSRGSARAQEQATTGAQAAAAKVPAVAGTASGPVAAPRDDCSPSFGPLQSAAMGRWTWTEAERQTFFLRAEEEAFRVASVPRGVRPPCQHCGSPTGGFCSACDKPEQTICSVCEGLLGKCNQCLREAADCDEVSSAEQWL